MKLNHIHLNTPSVGRTLEFYETYFGFRRRPQEPDAPTFLEDDDGFLMAVDETTQPIAFPSWFHLGFAKLQPEQVRALHRRMKADGVRMAKDLIEEDDVVAFWCYDPAGYKVEVSWFKANFQ